MGPVLHGLIKLQSVENRLRAVKSKLIRCRRDVIFQENQLRILQNGLEAKKEEIKLVQIQIDRLELELKEADAHIAKFRAALNLAKSNKEYAAILTELNTSKADNAKVENQVLDLMKNIEADKTDCGQVQAQIDEQKLKIGQLRKDSEVQAGKYEAEIKRFEVKYHMDFKSFQEKIEGLKNREVFTEEDDYLDWRFAKESLDRLLRQKQELEYA